MSFRLNADMYVVAPKVQLAHYVDLTMPKRDWRKYERPIRSAALPDGREFMATRYRTAVSKRETAPTLFIQRQAG